jgi:glycosyltransferase involved in cell wall biosynthesis
MKTVFIDWTGDPARPGASGLSDLTWAMAHRLARGGDDVHVIGPYTTAFDSGDVSVHRFDLPPLGYRNIVGHIFIALRALDCLRRIGSWDIVHAPEYLTTALGSVLLPNTPIVLTVPGNIFERINNINHFDLITTQVYKLAARISARKCATIIATSREQARWWAYSGAKPHQIAIIPLGVDTLFFRPDQRLNRNSDNHRPCVLFVGRLQGENGADLAIRAFSLVHRVLPCATLSIVGDGPDRTILKALCTQLGLVDAVRWHDRVRFEDLPAVYQSADVFIFPRISRVTPRVLFEAMACGLPVVTSAIGGIIDFVVDGETGFLVDPYDIQSLARRVVELLQSPDQGRAMGMRARAFVQTQLDWDIIVRRIRHEVYKPLICHQPLS